MRDLAAARRRRLMEELREPTPNQPATNTDPDARALLAAALLFNTRPTDRALIGWYDGDIAPGLEVLAQRPIRAAGDGD